MKTEDYTNNNPGYFAITIVLIVLLSFFSFLFITIDWGLFNGFIGANVFTKSDCNYEIPKDYTILTNDKYYIIQHKTSYSTEYMTTGILLEYQDFNSFSKPTKLVSECKAKGYLKKYISKQDPAKGFKPIQTEK